LAKTNLQTLRLRKCQINPKTTEIIAYAIAKNPIGPTALTSLDLSSNLITQEGAKILAPALEENKSIVHLDLS
jgi:Ran GTPase-activating protein (RanGAP) involved in mRNA processing and transport